jgi:hypothetical protein
MAYRIIHDWWTECSSCGGNATLEGEAAHIHGGPDVGGSMGPTNERSYLGRENGCGAQFDEPSKHIYW